MGLRGSVKAFSLEQCMEFLNSSGHTGTLEVYHKDARKFLYLHQSSVYLERSNWSFRLGDAMVRSGEITSEHLEAALTHQKDKEGMRLGEALIDLGHTTNQKIIAARRFQVEEEIYELFSWEDAFFKFEKGELPKDFETRRADPDEFNFPITSVLVEATRRRDEWNQIQETLPSEKRLYVLSSVDGAVDRARKELEEAKSRITDPLQVFDGMKTLGMLPHLLGLSRFETKAVVCKLINYGDVRQLARHELESRFRMAIRQNLDYALTLYEGALESPEFEARGRFLDRVFFGSEAFKTAAEEQKIGFSARIKGKRAFELLLALFRQGIDCEFTVREEEKNVRVGFSKNSLLWRVAEGQSPPSIVKHLLARSPVSASDLVRVREMQEQTGRSLQEILVGGGYVTMDNWFRAQKDTVLNEIFAIFFMKRPYVEVKTKEERAPGTPGLDIDVPLLPWLHAEVMREIRQWETLLSQIPSVRAYLRVTPKGQKSLKGHEDPILLFNGQHSLEEVLGLQNLSAQEFLADVHTKLQSGRLAPLEAEDYRERLEAAMGAGKRTDAINYCLAAIESDIDAQHFRERIKELRAGESELSAQSSRTTLRGDLASFSLPELLQTFHLRKSSGTMRVEVTEHDRKRSRQIYFDQGDVFLLSGDLDEVITEQDLEVGLIAAGLITEDQLQSEAAQQMKNEVYEMFLWEGAEFEFSADYLPPEFYSTKGNRKIKLHTLNFLLEAVRRISDWEEVRRTIPSDDMVLAFDNNMAKMNTVNERGNEDLLLLADGRHAISDLVKMSRTRRFKALTLLAELVQEGTLKVIDLEQVQEEDEDALFASDLPTSGVIEEGFVGQIQFVGTLQDLAGAGLTGIMRVTDGRRSKEIQLVEGDIYRTSVYVPKPKVDAPEIEGAEELSPEAKRLAEIEAMDMSEVPDDQRPRLEMEMKMLRMAIEMERAEQAEPEPEPEPEDDDAGGFFGGLDDEEEDDDDEDLGFLSGDGVEERELSPEEKRLAELDTMDMSEVPEEQRTRLETEQKMLRQAIQMEKDEEARRKDEEAKKKKEFEAAMKAAQEEMEEERRRKEAREEVGKESAVDTGRDFSECFSWRGTRFELLKSTIHPRLEKAGDMDAFWLHSETFFDVVAEAGERWVKVGELIPKDLVLVYTDDDCKAKASERAGEHPELADLVDSSNTPEDIARISGLRYLAMSWVVDLLEERLVEAVEPQSLQEGDAEEDWDFSL